MLRTPIGFELKLGSISGTLDSRSTFVPDRKSPILGHLAYGAKSAINVLELRVGYIIENIDYVKIIHGTISPQGNNRSEIEDTSGNISYTGRIYPVRPISYCGRSVEAFEEINLNRSAHCQARSCQIESEEEIHAGIFQGGVIYVRKTGISTKRLASIICKTVDVTGMIEVR
jgi:hypothetical protein